MRPLLDFVVEIKFNTEFNFLFYDVDDVAIIDDVYIDAYLLQLSIFSFRS